MLTKRSIPMLLTYLRLAAIPLAYGLWELAHSEPVVGEAYFPNGNYAALFIIFTLASLTDFLDGYLARRWQVTSTLGAMLDQIADKLLVATMLLILVYDHHIPAMIAVIILLREIFISGLRESLALKQVPLPVSKSGKWKTALQMVGVALTLLAVAIEQGALPILLLGQMFLILAALLTLGSGLLYLRTAWPLLR